jgi:hypothetical protein
VDLQAYKRNAIAYGATNTEEGLTEEVYAKQLAELKEEEMVRAQLLITVNQIRCLLVCSLSRSNYVLKSAFICVLFDRTNVWFKKVRAAVLDREGLDVRSVVSLEYALIREATQLFKGAAAKPWAMSGEADYGEGLTQSQRRRVSTWP